MLERRFANLQMSIDGEIAHLKKGVYCFQTGIDSRFNTLELQVCH